MCSKKICIFLIIAFKSYIFFGQSITLSVCSVYEKTKPLVQIVNSKTYFDATVLAPYISYEHFIQKKKISFFTSFCKFDGFSYVRFEYGGYVDGNGNPIDASGFSGIEIRRLDLGVKYNLMKKNRKFYFKPFIGIGLQHSLQKGNEIGNVIPINGPNYFQTEPIIATSLTNTQIVPSIGFRTGFIFWKRLVIDLGFQGVYGHKAYQKLTLKYEYKGVVQKDGEFESNGTGLFVTLGIGYRFVKLIKK
jgi:hypothetical protein